jgi:hypothetical protein
MNPNTIPTTNSGKRFRTARCFAALLAAVLALHAALPARAKAADADRAWAAAYYRVASDIIYTNNIYGIYTDQGVDGHGLAYAELVDFDANGVPELYVIYRSIFDSEFAVSTEKDLVEEIWTYRNGKAQRIYQEFHEPGGLLFDRAVAFTTAQGKTYIHYTSLYSHGRGDYPYENVGHTWDTWLALVNGQVREVAHASITEEEHVETGEWRITYEIGENGKERVVSEQEYQKFLKKYGKDTRREIISSSAGLKEFALDMSGNKERIEAFLQSLKDKMRAKNLGSDLWPQFSQTEKNGLTSFLFNFVYYPDIDLRHYEDADLMNTIRLLHFNGQLDREMSKSLKSVGNDGDRVDKLVKGRGGIYEWPHSPYSAEAYAEAARAFFGIELEKKTNDFAYYENGYFYIRDFEVGGDPEKNFPRIRGLYALGEGQYYAEYDVYGVYFGDYEDLDRYRNDYETLTAREKEAAYWLGSGYALLNRTQESPYGWHLVYLNGSGVLPDEKEINAYKSLWKTRNNPDRWAAEEVNAAIQANLAPRHLQGWYGIPVTRAEFSRLIMQFLYAKTGKTMEELLEERGRTLAFVFSDTDESAAAAAHALGIVNGKGDGRFDPDGLITRQEAAVMLANAAKLVGIKAGGQAPKFTDSGRIASWAKEAVSFVSTVSDRTNGAKVMGGVSEGQFGPSATFTRQQAIVAVKRLFNA